MILGAIILGGLLAALVSFLLPKLRKKRPDQDDETSTRAAPPPPWVGDLRKRLEKEGAERGASRHRTETIAAYADRLATTVLPDARLVSVGTVLTAALFGPVQIDPSTAAWAESVVDEVTTAYPKDWQKTSAAAAAESPPVPV